MPSDARTQWAAYELQRRLQRADTPTEQASVWRDAERAQQDPEFLARLAEIAERGKYSSGPWGLGKLALAGGTLAGLIPGLQPLGLASGAALAGLAIPTGLEAIQRRSEGLPWKWQAAEAALDLAAPGVSKLGGLLRGLRGVKPQTTQALVRVGQPPPTPRTGAERVGDVWQAPGQVQTRAERVAEETMRRGTHPDQLSMPQVLARMSAPLEGTVPAMGRSVPATPGRGFSPGAQRLGVPGVSPTNPQTGRPFTEFELLNREAQRVAPSRQSLQVDPALTARFNRPIAGTTPVTGASRAATPGVTSVTNPLTGRPYTDFELLNIRAGRTGAAQASPDAAPRGFGGVPATGTWGTLGAFPQGGPSMRTGGPVTPPARPKAPPKTPEPTAEPTAAPQGPTPTQAEATQAAAASTQPTPAPVALAQIREELQAAGVGTAQLGFLESFLSQVDDIGEPGLRALREAALDTPGSRRAQEVLMDRLIRYIPAQGGVGVATPKLRASMAHLFAGGSGGGQAKVPGGLISPSAGRTVIPAGAINPATGEVTEQALLRGQMPGTERSFGLGHEGVTAPTETMDAFSSTVGGTSPEWKEAAKQVKGLITEGMTPNQIKAVTGYQVAYNRLDGLKRYIQQVLQFNPHRQRGAGGQFRPVGDKELIGDLVRTQGTRPRTIYRDLRDLARKVGAGEVTTEHMQKTIDQINKTALQLLGVIGSIEMARRVLAPGQTANAPLT